MKTITKNPMTSINVSLPTGQRQFIERRVSKGGYGTVSEYIRELVRRDEKSHLQLDTLLLEGFESGDATAMTSKDWADIRKDVKRRTALRKQTTTRQ